MQVTGLGGFEKTWKWVVCFGKLHPSLKAWELKLRLNIQCCNATNSLIFEGPLLVVLRFPVTSARQMRCFPINTWQWWCSHHTFCSKFGVPCKGYASLWRSRARRECICQMLSTFLESFLRKVRGEGMFPKGQNAQIYKNKYFKLHASCPRSSIWKYSHLFFIDVRTTCNGS